jgi:hypothetical protein
LIQLVEHNTNIQNDIDLIANIDAVSTILQVVCESTGMGFAAVARVTEETVPMWYLIMQQKTAFLVRITRH